jgi:hypothetical protein
MIEAAGKAGRPMDQTGDSFKQWMEEAGFENIEIKIFAWPSNVWPKNKSLKEIGRWNEINLIQGVEGFTLALLTRVLGWSKAEVEILSAKVKNDLKNRSIHAYFEM